jgi:hypothetical protein
MDVKAYKQLTMLEAYNLLALGTDVQRCYDPRSPHDADGWRPLSEMYGLADHWESFCNVYGKVDTVQFRVEVE